MQLFWKFGVAEMYGGQFYIKSLKEWQQASYSKKEQAPGWSFDNAQLPDWMWTHRRLQKKPLCATTGTKLEQTNGKLAWVSPLQSALEMCPGYTELCRKIGFLPHGVVSRLKAGVTHLGALGLHSLCCLCQESGSLHPLAWRTLFNKANSIMDIFHNISKTSVSNV